MKKRFIICAAVCALALAGAMALTGCNASSSFGFDFSDDFVTGSVSAENNSLTVELDGSPSTGYEWTAKSDSDAVTLVSSEYTEEGGSSSTSEMDGASGTYAFGFEGSAADTSTLTFDYARSWESTGDEVHLTVEVTTDDSGSITALKVMDGDTVLGETK